MWLRLLVGKHEACGRPFRNSQMMVGRWHAAGMATMDPSEHMTKHKVADWPRECALV